MIPDYHPAQIWPPESERDSQRLYRESHAWYSGDPESLQSVYGGGEQRGVEAQTEFARTGMRGLIQRFWWGRPPTLNQSTTHLHVPIAADLASFSSDMLYGDLPQFRVPAAAEDGKLNEAEKATQTALNLIVKESGLSSVLSAGAEIGSAFGGRYVGVRTDTTMSPDAPMFFNVPPECAIPEWRYGRLRAVTFWQAVGGPTKSVYRHLERHEVAGGRAMIYHALYEGSDSELGRLVDLTVSPETAEFAFKVDESGGIDAGCTVLDVQYVPNMLPHRLMPGSPLGRSDVAGVEPLMDALDETYSSWMRDIRNGKGRVLVPSEYLKSLGPGKGATFDAEQEIFQTIEVMQNETTYVRPEIVQFAIRTADHEAACASHVRAIVRAAGLSQGAFGEEVDGGQATAKEVGERKSRTSATRAKKINYETFALRMILFAALEQAKALIGGKAYAGVTPVRPDIEFADSSAPDAGTFALTLKALREAKVASTQTLVEMLHPEWDEEAVKAEVERIDAPQGDPDQFDGSAGGNLGRGGPGGEGDEEDDDEGEPTAPPEK